MDSSIIDLLIPRDNLQRASGHGVPPSGGGAWELPVVGRIFNSPDQAIALPAKAGTPYPDAKDHVRLEKLDAFLH